MASDPRSTPLLTLEPLIEAVREGVAETGWELSGLQKTTSHEFEGRWAGDSTRSAYLFFHPPEGREEVSVDVLLDETPRGLTGNLALVLDAGPLSLIPDVTATLDDLGSLAAQFLPSGYRRPVTLRLRLADVGTRARDASAEVRFKIQIPRSALEGGIDAVVDLSKEAVRAFERLLESGGLDRLLEG